MLLSASDFELGKKLHLHRVSCGMQGTEVAAAMGVSTSTISRWENGQSSIPVFQLRLLAQVLAIDAYWDLLR